MMYTRKDYMNGLVTHQEYYRQFVTVPMMALVTRAIGFERIEHSSDPAFNDIPLEEWDRLASAVYNCLDHTQFRHSGEWWTLGVAVCVAKAAARAVKEPVL